MPLTPLFVVMVPMAKRALALCSSTSSDPNLVWGLQTKFSLEFFEPGLTQTAAKFTILMY